jgi:RNA polymerase sigma-70 factor, ECF subfamily
LKALQRKGDERILVEAAQRDPRRFADLYEQNFDLVYAFIARRIRDRHETEDLTSEVFHRALKNLGRFEWRGAPFGAWLIRIAANAINDHAHRSARHAELGDQPAASDPPGLEEAECRARLFRMVDDLPADQRRVIVMRFAEERSIREIATAIGRSEGAVKQLQFRGLKNLKARMGKTDA